MKIVVRSIESDVKNSAVITSNVDINAKLQQAEKVVGDLYNKH